MRKQLDGFIGEPHVELLMDQLIGRTLKMVLHGDMVIDIDLGPGPDSQLKREGGQGQKPASLERFEPTIARTFQLLKRLLIEFLQKRRHSVIELSHIEKAMVAQCGQDLPLGDQNAPLHLRLIAGLLFAGRDDHGAIVFGQFLVTAVQQRFVTAGTNDPGLEIIRNRDSTDALKESPSMAMSSKPSAQLLVVEGLDIRLLLAPSTATNKWPAERLPSCALWIGTV